MHGDYRAPSDDWETVDAADLERVATLGLRAGEVILRLGEHPVPDLQGLTDALTAHRPGDRVPILRLREGTELTVNVTLARRGGS